MTLLRLLSMAPPTCCGRPMTWDVLRASYVCGACGTAR